MKENLEIAFDFAKKINKIKGILQIALFGSLTRGEETPRSDIDIAVVFDNVDKFELAKEINKFKHEKIQLTFINLRDLSQETELIGALSGEGLLLYGRPIKIKINNLELNPRVLLSYSLKNISQTEKVKLNRALHGSISRSEFKGKKYVTKTKGLTNEAGVDKINKGVLLVDRSKAAKIVNTLKRFKADLKERIVWTY